MRIDPDTNAAIAGAVLAAKYQNMDRLKDLIEIVVSVDTKQGMFSRPDKYP